MIDANGTQITDEELLKVYDACSSMTEAFPTKAQFLHDINEQWDATWTACYERWYERTLENAIFGRKMTALLNTICCMCRCVDD